MASSSLISVTSLVRTWPSTIFWRAVAKSDIVEPNETKRTGRGKGEKSAPSLVQGFAKRNMPRPAQSGDVAGADVRHRIACGRDPARAEPCGIRVDPALERARQWYAL